MRLVGMEKIIWGMRNLLISNNNDNDDDDLLNEIILGM